MGVEGSLERVQLIALGDAEVDPFDAGGGPVFELHAAGKTHVTREIRPLAQVNESIADVEAGRVAARIVLEP